MISNVPECQIDKNIHMMLFPEYLIDIHYGTQDWYNNFILEIRGIFHDDWGKSDK